MFLIKYLVNITKVVIKSKIIFLLRTVLAYFIIKIEFKDSSKYFILNFINGNKIITCDRLQGNVINK